MELVGDGGKAEVGDLEVAPLVDEEVLGLEVAVEDAARVAEADGGDELLEVPARGVLLEAALGDAGEELPAADELHDEVDLGLCCHDLEEAHDVGVADAAEDGDLALDLRDEAVAERLLLVEHLDGDGLPGVGVAGVVDLGEGAVAQDAAELVAPQQEPPALAVAAPHGGRRPRALRRRVPRRRRGGRHGGEGGRTSGGTREEADWVSGGGEGRVAGV